MLLLSLATLVLSSASPTAIFIPRSINLEQGEADTLGAVCATEYAKVSQGEVIMPGVAARAVGPNGSLVEAAQALGAAELVELTVVSLASRGKPGRMLINGLRRALDGRELYRADVTAESLDDSPVACERLALALTRQVPTDRTLDHTNVTAAEARRSRRHNRLGSEVLLGVKVGLGVPVISTGQANPIGTLSFDARFERERWFIEVGAGVLVPAVVSSSNLSYGGLAAELGASYYLTPGDTGVYLGGGVQPRLVFSGTVLNLAPYAQLGVTFMRESSMRVFVDARVSQNVLPVTSGYTTSPGLYPTELLAQVGIGW